MGDLLRIVGSIFLVVGLVVLGAGWLYVDSKLEDDDP